MRHHRQIGSDAGCPYEVSVGAADAASDLGCRLPLDAPAGLGFEIVKTDRIADFPGYGSSRHECVRVQLPSRPEEMANSSTKLATVAFHFLR